jgi:hypothetical protein
MNAFLRWVLVVAAITLGGVYAQYELDVFGLLRDGDPTYIGFAVVALCIGMSINCGYSTWRLEFSIKHWNDNGEYMTAVKDKVHSNLEQYGFYAGVFTMLGMIGTVVGFIMAIPALTHISPEDPGSISKAIEQLSTGVSTALYTTLVGLVASIVLRLQRFNLSQRLNEHADDSEVLS